MYKGARVIFVLLRGNFIGMTITELQQLYAAHPNMAMMKRLLKDTSVQTIFCGGLYASAASLFFFYIGAGGRLSFCLYSGRSGGSGVFLSRLDASVGDRNCTFLSFFVPPFH